MIDDEGSLVGMYNARYYLCEARIPINPPFPSKIADLWYHADGHASIEIEQFWGGDINAVTLDAPAGTVTYGALRPLRDVTDDVKKAMGERKTR